MLIEGVPLCFWVEAIPRTIHGERGRAMVFIKQNIISIPKYGFCVGVLRRFVVLMTTKSFLRKSCAHGVLDLNGVIFSDRGDFSLNERAHGEG